MIFHDEDGRFVNETLDGGDSAMRAGMMAMFSTALTGILAYEVVVTGQCVRHPKQVPWNNSKNFTRDQLIPLMAGYYVRGFNLAPRRVFWAHAKRLFICQNFERDYVGSTKYPWPHTFINDKGERETRLFDFADVLMPDHVWHLIKCARLTYLYWFALIGVPWFCLSLFFHSRSSHKEHNQIVAMAKVQGRWAEKLFMKLVPNWREDLRQYWGSRNEIEYAEMIIENLEG